MASGHIGFFLPDSSNILLLEQNRKARLLDRVEGHCKLKTKYVFFFSLDVCIQPGTLHRLSPARQIDIFLIDIYIAHNVDKSLHFDGNPNQNSADCCVSAKDPWSHSLLCLLGPFPGLSFLIVRRQECVGCCLQNRRQADTNGKYSGYNTFENKRMAMEMNYIP